MFDIKYIIKGIRKYKLNLWKTILINFKAFPFRIAINFPVICYGKVILNGIHRGCIELHPPLLTDINTSVGCFNTLKIGGTYSRITGLSYVHPTILSIFGTWKVGHPVIINNGCTIYVHEHAKLVMDDFVYIGRDVKIYCDNSIFIGNHCRISWDVQIFDTNFHYTSRNGVIGKKLSPVYIDHHCWVGNRTTVNKGAYLCPYSIVASNSLLNKSFKEKGEKCVIGGIPAKFITSGMSRIFDFKKEFFLDEYFHNHPDESISESQLQQLMSNNQNN